MSESDAARAMLRHTVVTLAYRAAKAVQGAPGSFANFRIAETSRTPAQILTHMGDLFYWALSIARSSEQWHDSEPLVWEKEVQRFFASLRASIDILRPTSRSMLLSRNCSKVRLPTH